MKITRKLAAAAVAALAALALGVTTASASPAPVTRTAGVHVTTATTTTLAVAWTAPASGVRVRIQVYDADTLTDTFDTAHLTPNADVSGTKVTATGLAAGTAYDVRADAYAGTANAGWTAPVTVYTAAQGSTGTQGPAGPAGPSGVVSVATHDLGSVASVATGGPFATGKTLAGTVSLKAGTYLVSVNAKATPLTSSAAEVFPQFMIYNGAPLADFSNDLFNVGAGPLASLNTSIDSYYSGTSVVTLAADSTIDLYAFGYDSDRGAGSYRLDDLTVTAVQLQAAS